MIDAQRLWWEQSKSDLRVFKQLRALGAHPCHLLHYLQMATEKLSKAYFCALETRPRKLTQDSFGSCEPCLPVLQESLNGSVRGLALLGQKILISGSPPTSDLSRTIS